MSPILGIWASQISGRLWEPQGAYDALSTVTVPSGGVASITFAGIPNTYKHLQIRCSVRMAATGTNNDNILMVVNSDTGSNYNAHYLYGDGATALASGVGTGSATYVGRAPFSNTTANTFSGTVLDILDYANTNKNKTFRSISGSDLNGSGDVFLWSGLWMSTNAINTVLLRPSANNFAQYSTFALYGVK